MQVDHLTIPVSVYDRGKRFYGDVLRSLGFTVRLDWKDKRRIFFGADGEPSSLWVCESHAAGTLDVSLAVADVDMVHAFHDAAVAAGARADGEPGTRADRSRDHYAARIIDPDGNRIEVVCRRAAARRSRPLAA